MQIGTICVSLNVLHGSSQEDATLHVDAVRVLRQGVPEVAAL